ncbi:hypothetical protein Trco_003896 [Trichoderma cornu-damae]|uniref:Uncharacterized protein n=1 Tax=Trichoderma cornu-damae TaxID=654480 RepID=A0A9P8TWL4_9HYPO|nr:hypothetical protein Trco_003896 [Trichoderma cornu-damae]
MVPPCSVWDKVPEGTPGGPGEQPLVGELQLIKEHGFLAVAPVDVTKHVEAGFDAPNLFEQMSVAEAEVEVVFLR